MYAIRNLFDKHPIQLGGAIMAWVNLAIIAGWWELTGEAASALNLCLVATLGLFVATKTTNTAVLSELTDTPPTLDGIGVENLEPTKPKRSTRKASGASDVVVLIVVVLIVLLLLGYFGGVR